MPFTSWAAGRGRRQALLAGVSTVALMVTGAVSPGRADPAKLLSPANLSQIANQRAASQSAAGNAAGALANPSLAPHVALSAANLARAAQAVRALNLGQEAARAADNLTLGGAPLSGLQPVDDRDPAQWINADPLQKDIANLTASVRQTAANALLNWRRFDIDRGETLVFDQQNHADWTVMNRVVPDRNADGSRVVVAPSQILGTIKAPGSVYVINPNGVIFGANSQINVHSLIASSLDVGGPNMTQAERNNFFLNKGIASVGTNETSFAYDARDDRVEGDIVVQAGARLTTSELPRDISPDAGGFVYLFAPNVTNEGTISTPAGQTMMVAAQQIQLTKNAYPDAKIDQSPKFRATGVNSTSRVDLKPWRLDGTAEAQISRFGTVTNNGLIQADRGVVILNGDKVTLNGGYFDYNPASKKFDLPIASRGAGVISADTSITRNAQIFLDARVQLTIGADSLVQIQPSENGETIPLSALANFVPGSIEMRSHTIDLEPGALISAPGATVAATHPEATTRFHIDSNRYPAALATQVVDAQKTALRFYMAPNSAIDVSGLNGVALAASANLVTFKPFGNEFADSPLQRNGALRGQELTVDIRQTGTLDGNAWVGTPLADVTGLAGNVQRGIEALLTAGGSVSVSGGDEVILRQGSSVNVSGGYVQYQPGAVKTTNLLTADGRIVNIAKASPLDSYVGVAGVSVQEHPHWGVSQSFVSPLIAASGAQFDPGYVEGSDAGAAAFTAKSHVLDGTLAGGVTVGPRQSALGKRKSSATDFYALPRSAQLALGGVNNLTVQKTVAPLENFSVTDVFSPQRDASGAPISVVSSDILSEAGFGSIAANFTGDVRISGDAKLTVAPGGSISLKGGAVDIQGTLVARSGAIAAESTGQLAGGPNLTADNTTFDRFDLKLGPGAVLDASGIWVNDGGASPDAVTGGGYIDGGTISLATDTQSVSCGLNCFVDRTGSIVLSAGSQLDVTSGGRINERGQLQRDSLGRPVGKGGNVALRTYVGAWGLDTQAADPAPPTAASPSANVIFKGSDGTAAGTLRAIADTVHAYGFAQGGTLTIRAPGIQIGGTPPAAGKGTFYVPEGFFAGNGFGNYNLSAVVGGITVAPGSTVALRQRNLLESDDLPGLATGAKLRDSVAVGYLDDFRRAPVGLQLNASLPGVPYGATGAFQPGEAVPPSVVALLLGEGATIDADPGARIGMQVTGRPGFAFSKVGAPIPQQTAVASILGTIRAPGGTIAIGDGGPFTEIYLGEKSVLDTAGVYVRNERQPLFNTGKLYSGGTVSINLTFANSAIVARQKALIDVSGAASVIDVISEGVVGGLQVATATPTAAWSDAGAITLAASTVLYDGDIRAKGGADTANGGSLKIANSQQGDVVVLAAGNVAASLGATDALPADRIGQAYVQVDRLAGSGIAHLTLAASPSGGDDLLQPDGTLSSAGNFKPGTIVFDGATAPDTKIEIGARSAPAGSGDAVYSLQSLILDASNIQLRNFAALTKPVQPWLTAPSDCNVCLAAGYVALRGGRDVPASALTPPTASATGSLTLRAKMIDIAAGVGDNGVLRLSDIKMANFVSDGDIRLRVPLANAPRDLGGATLPSGELLTSGHLALTAKQVYPMSNVDFTLKSIGADGRIRILGNGTPDSKPLSAGGEVTISAAYIEQNGTLLAPLGIIRLGARSVAELSPTAPHETEKTVGDTKVPEFVVVPTQSVTLGAGSITSVSLDGMLVPYGETANGGSWSYASPEDNLPLAALPAKDIRISGAAIGMDDTSVLDLRGGGDLQAMEFVRGTGGSRDVLARDPNVFAVIPGYNPAAAPLDLDFLLAQGDAVPAPGRNVYLSGGAGLAAGYYTLLPAHYATLPGAYRVKLVAASQGAAPVNQVLQDGTARVAGYFAQPGAGTRDAFASTFDVQSSAVWRQYSEIAVSSANTYFSAPAQRSVAPRLPTDAGHLALSAVSALDLDGRILTSPANGGRGAAVDVGAQNIQIVSRAGMAASGFLKLEATQLNALGADSLLIGGVRRIGADGDVVTVTADRIRVSNDDANALEAPEMILVAKSDLTLDGGSMVRASGTPAAGGTSRVTIGDTEGNVSGQGSLLAVSNGNAIEVRRQSVTTGSVLAVGAGATLFGAALNLDTTGNMSVAGSATLAASDISVRSSDVNFGNFPANASGFNVSAATLAQLEQAKTLRLASFDMINFHRDVDITLAEPDSKLVIDARALVGRNNGQVTLGADEVVFTNSGKSRSFGNGGARLRVDAGEVDLGAGDKAFGLFNAVSVSATRQVVTRDTGTLNVGSAVLTVETPVLLVGGGSRQTITTTGNAVLRGATGPASPSGAVELGGTLILNAAAIAVDTLVQATSGGVTLHASAGDIALGSQGAILANGYAQNFFDVTRTAPGGSVRLTADNGGISVAGSARIDVSSAAGHPGDGGDIALSAANGDLSSDGGHFAFATIAGSVAGDGGGTLAIDARGLGAAGVASLDIPSMFSDTVDVRVREGDLRLGSNFGAQTVTLTADKGVLDVDKTIDASGAKGGKISLFGGRGVTLASGGALIATASDAKKRGGDIVIGTQVGSANGSGADGVIDLRAGSAIDVRNLADAAKGGTVRLRAPLIGAAQDDVAIAAVGAEIEGARSVTVEAFRVFDTHNSAFNGVIDPARQGGFYGSCTVAGACSGTLLEFVQNFSLSAASRGKFAGIDSSVLHLQPGIELVNDDLSVNSGNITVAANWNLGAGTYDATAQKITDLFYRVGANATARVTGEPGTLTLRAARDLEIDADITDGFFQTEDRLNPAYVAAMNAWVAKLYNADATIDAQNPANYIRNVGGYTLAGALYPGFTSKAGPPPVAPYNAAANQISPTQASVIGADLFPDRAIGSWSYNLVAGADTGSANPLALAPLAKFADGADASLAKGGNVRIDGHTNVDVGGGTVPIPTIVRTGTGGINIAAGRDFVLADNVAPGVVYAAGRNAAPLLDPGFALTELPNPVPDPLNPTIRVPVAGHPDGFLTPKVLACRNTNGCAVYGAISAAAFPEDGGDVTIVAQRDIVGRQDLPNRTQFYAPWLMVQGDALPSTEFGAFSPLSAYVSNSRISTPSQTAWWINFGSFDQGIMSVGGDVVVRAGRDIDQLSVSAPTTARTQGGLAAGAAPKIVLNDSGDITVIAGRDILSGAFYEGSGTGRIEAGGAVKGNWQGPIHPYDRGFGSQTVSTVLALDTGTIALRARGAIDLAGVVSATSLHNVADISQLTNRTDAAFVSSYGPASKVTVQSISGDVTVNSLRNGEILIDKVVSFLHSAPAGYGGINLYPASFEAVSLVGDVRIAGALFLAPSDTGNLVVLAGRSILSSSTSVESTFTGRMIGTGPSLVEKTFDPLRPNAGFDGLCEDGVTDCGARLLHQADPAPVLIYAATGDIATAPPLEDEVSATLLRWEIGKPAQVRVGRDIVDMAFFGQNLAPTDVTQISAGRDIYYTDNKLTLQGTNGALNLAGPGFFDVAAGRNLGPFVTPAANKASVDINTDSGNPVANPTGDGIITTGNNVVVGNRLISGNAFEKSQNFLLPHRGADIIASFGVGNGIDHHAVIDAYVNPATATSPRSYVPALVSYLQTLDPNLPTTDPWATFTSLPAALQDVFAKKVFFSELQFAGTASPPQYEAGFAAVKTLFPSTLGYTDVADPSAEPVVTGRLEMLHATIKTMQSAILPVEGNDGATTRAVGGDIMLLGPGGSTEVGATATEVNTRLTNSGVGILTLNNGTISSFTDGSVLVNQSRILTVQGGDILMWSSNGDLDAGRGAKTTVDYKPLQVSFSPQDLQTIDLTGLVSGAGIGTIQSTPDAPAASASLIAPRGTVNAGDAGLRSSGELNIAALQVLNAANIAASGAVSGVPQAEAADLGALSSISTSAGQANSAATEAVAAAAQRGQPSLGPRLPSIITVEVLGYGEP